MTLGREPGDVTDPGQQAGGAGGADAMQAGQPGACLFDQGDEFLVRGLLARAGPLEADDELQRDALACLPGHVLRPDGRQQLAGLGGREVLLCATRKEFQQEHV